MNEISKKDFLDLKLIGLIEFNFIELDPDMPINNEKTFIYLTHDFLRYQKSVKFTCQFDFNGKKMHITCFTKIFLRASSARIGLEDFEEFIQIHTTLPNINVKIIDEKDENSLQTCKELIVKNEETIRKEMFIFTRRNPKFANKLDEEIARIFDSFLPFLPPDCQIIVNKIDV